MSRSFSLRGSVTTWWRAVRSRPRRARSALVVLLGVLALAVVAAAPEAFGGFGAAVGGTGQTASGTLVLADTTAGSTCVSAPNVAGGLAGDTAVCPTSLLAPTVGASRTVTVANEGSLTPSSTTLSTGRSCGVEKLADAAAGSGDPGLVVGGTTVGVPGPPALAGAKAVAFDGSSGYAETVAGPTQSFDAAPGPQTFSIAAWFETTTGGSVIGFTNSQSDANQTMWDRQLWVDPAGHVVFGLYPNRFFELSSAQTTAKDYANGAWHLAVVTVTPVTATRATVELYVDGQLVAGGRRDEAITNGQPAQDYGGYWHLGWSNAAAGWPDPPGGAFWQGALTDVAVVPTALSASQVTSLSAPTSQAAFAAAVAALGPESFWTMQGTAASRYTGPVADLASAGTTFPDESGNPGTNTGTGQGGLAPSSAGPLSGSGTSFNGSTGWIETTTGPPTPFYTAPGPQTFSIAAWFETTTGGSVIGFTNSQSDANQTMWDRQLWVDPAGHVVFGLYPNRFFELSSAQTTAKDYANGAWHLAVVTVTPVTATRATVELYVDGQLVAGGRRDEAITNGQPAQDYGGYWHLGWSNAAAGWPDPPGGAFWQGALAQVAVFPTALSGAQVRSLSQASTDTAYATAVTGGVAAANAYWPLAATQAGGFPCDLLAVTVQLGTGTAARCLAPAGSGPCPAPASGDPPDVVASLPTGGGTLTFATGTTAPVPPAAQGLHLVVPWQLVARAGSFSAQLDHPGTTVEL
ncbi:MAG: LamG-like jellyroll fold domain-containing protein [Acidimicrobiales bacterium]